MKRPPRRCGNLGATAQKLRRRTADPMAAFDALPAALRQWMSQAVLPWSPASCRRLWAKAHAQGATTAAALMLLDRAQANALKRENRGRT